MKTNIFYTFRNKTFSKQDIKGIQKIINRNWSKGRMKIARIICEELNWRTFTGDLKIVACKDALKRMAQKNLIKLPKSKSFCKKIKIKKIKYHELNFKIQKTNLEGSVDNSTQIRFKKVETEEDKKLFRYLIQRYHYLSYKTIVGRNIKYLIFLDNNLVGVIAFADAILHHHLRDNWIGWDKKTRMKNLHLVVNNIRFLILPWVKVKNLASKILSIASKTLPKDWKEKYGYEPVLFETFVDLERFLGTSYKASNWIYCGTTIGKGRKGMKYFFHNRLKALYVYPLSNNAKEILLGKK